MRRREFVFSSMKAAALLSPLLSARRVEAQGAVLPPRVFFWVNCQGYPHPDDMFPQPGAFTAETELPFILSGLAPLKDNLVVVDGVSIAHTGFDNGNNHVRTMGKVLTAHDILPNENEEGDGIPGDISIDQRLARDLGWQSMELLLNDRDRGEMRDRPFALGERTYKAPFVEPWAAWNRAFGDFTGNGDEAQRLKRLRRKRSLLDGLVGDLGRLRQELTGIERDKLNVHEDAIRSTEQSVQRDIDNAPAQCAVPGMPDPGSYMPDRAAAHMDVMFSAFACQRVQVGGICWGSSGYHWPYQWVPGVDAVDTIHDEIHHREGERRDSFRRAARWDWEQLSLFAQRLKNTTEGTGTMLDNTLIVAVSHFGHHHSGQRIPVVLIGGAQGRLAGGRAIQLNPGVDNSKLLTSVAHLMGHPIAGFGDHPDCGVIPELVG